MIIVMGVVALALLVFFSYQLYSRRNLNQLNPENPKMRRKISVYKHQENNRLIVSLMITVVIISLLFGGVLYEQYSIRKDIKELQLDVEAIEKGEGTSAEPIEEYKENSLKLSEFPWQKVVESSDITALRNYELQLSRDWAPFFGEVNTMIVRGQGSNSLTVSVFSNSLTFEDYKIAEKNVEKFIKELNGTPQVTMIDFNFTYRDESKTLSKQSFAYSRADKDSNLEKVQLDN